MHHNLKALKSKLDNESLVVELNKLLNNKLFIPNVNACKFPETPDLWLVIITLHFTNHEMVIYMKESIDYLDIDAMIKKFNNELTYFMISSETKDTKRDSLFRPVWGFRDCLDYIEQNNNL